MTSLQSLILDDCAAGDLGFEHLKCLTGLRVWSMNRRHPSAMRAWPCSWVSSRSCTCWTIKTAVGDASLARVGRRTQLRRLELVKCVATNGELAHLCRYVA